MTSPGSGARPPRVVAELGRPETPEETAARKAEASRRHRANQTVRNLIYALIVCLGVVLLIVVVVVRPDQPVREPVDWSAVAADAQPAVDAPLVDPQLPPGWTANQAELDGSASVPEWYIGFISPGDEFVGFRQGVGADASWLAGRLEDSPVTGEVDIDGVTWQVHDRRDRSDPGNLAYALSTADADSTYVLYGTATDEDFRTLASAIVAEMPEADVAPGSDEIEGEDAG